MTDKSIIDESSEVPRIKNTRITMLDILAWDRIDPDIEETLRNLFDQEENAEEVLEYLRENRDKLEDMEEDIHPDNGGDKE